jgi:hypothetical protein
VTTFGAKKNIIINHLWISPGCKGNLTILRRILYLDLAKGNSKDPWLGQTTNDIQRIAVPSLLVPSLP